MRIPEYPEMTDLDLSMRRELHPRFQKLQDGISEFTFSGLYLFRKKHSYQISSLKNCLILKGKKGPRHFFMLPFGFPDSKTLRGLFRDMDEMKCVSESQRTRLLNIGYEVVEDRDNFDYLYFRKDMAELSGRKFHKKRNLIKAFVGGYDFEARPLLENYIPDAMKVLAEWRGERETPGDYYESMEALEKCEVLQLCGGIYYVDGKPVAYSLGEELMAGKSFVIHFEKAVSGYKGLWQFMNQAFASILPDIYTTINREQDLGEAGLRKAKLSYRPMGFVKKYKAAKR